MLTNCDDAPLVYYNYFVSVLACRGTLRDNQGCTALKKGVDCRSCHNDLIRGDGNVPPELS